MTQTNEDWQSDWVLFVQCVGEAYDRGLDDQQVTELFCDRTVRWAGRIREKDLDMEAPGIQVEMPITRIELANGFFANVGYLFLNIPQTDIRGWESIPDGSRVSFETTIERGYSLFPGIRWSHGSESKEGVLMLGTRDSHFIARID